MVSEKDGDGYEDIGEVRQGGQSCLDGQGGPVDPSGASDPSGPSGLSGPSDPGGPGDIGGQVSWDY